MISILLWLPGLLARTALIQAISDGGSKAETVWLKVKELIQRSIPSLGSIILMQLIVWFPIIIANILLFIGTKPLAESFTSGINAGEFPEFDFFSFGIIWILGMGVFLLTIPLLFIDAFSYRSIVVENLGTIAGIKRALSVIRKDIKPILGLAVLCAIIGLAFSFAVSLLLSPLLFVMMPLMRQVLVECTSDGGDFGAMAECMQRLNQQPLFIGLSLIVGIVSAAVSSVWVAFQSTAFTLAYGELTGNG